MTRRGWRRSRLTRHAARRRPATASRRVCSRPGHPKACAAPRRTISGTGGSHTVRWPEFQQQRKGAQTAPWWRRCHPGRDGAKLESPVDHATHLSNSQPSVSPPNPTPARGDCGSGAAGTAAAAAARARRSPPPARAAHGGRRRRRSAGSRGRRRRRPEAGGGATRADPRTSRRCETHCDSHSSPPRQLYTARRSRSPTGCRARCTYAPLPPQSSHCEPMPRHGARGNVYKEPGMPRASRMICLEEPFWLRRPIAW